MNRAGVFLVLTAVSVALLVAAVSWYLFSYGGSYSSLYGGTMGAMMGRQYRQGAVGPPWYLWSTVVVLSSTAVAGVAGAVYYLAYPRIRLDSPGPTAATATTAAPGESLSTLMRTLKQDERKVVEVLLAHHGVYLQKFIVKESGLSRLKTHRILSRLAERGVVTAIKSGNTNEIRLAGWLTRGDEGPSAPLSHAGSP